eukprot:6261939-Amphidinium_carterae.1
MEGVATNLGGVGARLTDRCVEPNAVDIGKNSPTVDRWWYVEKAMFPVAAKLLFAGAVGLPPVDMAAWMRQVPRPPADKGQLDDILRRTCSACCRREPIGGVVPEEPKAPNQAVVFCSGGGPPTRNLGHVPSLLAGSNARGNIGKVKEFSIPL